MVSEFRWKIFSNLDKRAKKSNLFFRLPDIKIALGIAFSAPIIFFISWILFSSKNRDNIHIISRKMEVTKA